MENQKVQIRKKVNEKGPPMFFTQRQPVIWVLTFMPRAEWACQQTEQPV